jgi:hypothetical protein
MEHTFLIIFLVSLRKASIHTLKKRNEALKMPIRASWAIALTTPMPVHLLANSGDSTKGRTGEYR